MEDGQIRKTYKGKTLTIEVSIITQQEDFTTKTMYHFLICNSLDYNLQFENND